MKRVSILLLLVLGVAIAAMPRTSEASPDAASAATTPATQIAGLCFGGPFNAVAPCPTAAPAPRAPIIPVKNLSVSGPVAAPAGTTSYQLHLTSQLVCFTPSEPIYVYTFGQSQAAALSVEVPTPSTSGTPQPFTFSTSPSGFEQDNAQHLVLTPGPDGTSNLSLEVFNKAVGNQGLGVAALWPDEQISRSQVLIQPVAGTPGAVATATPAPAATATVTPGPTTTPAPGPFTLRACVSPSAITQNSPATLYVQTAPGATCSASLDYANNVHVPTLGGPQLAGADGFAVFPFTPGAAGPVVAAVTCTLLGVTEKTTATFTAAPAPIVASSGGTSGVAPPACIAPGTGFQANVEVGSQHPAQNTTEVVAGCFFENGLVIPGVPVTFQFSYANNTSQSCSTFTGFDGSASCGINIVKAPAGYPATVTAFFMYAGGTYTATTSFTPVAAG